MCGFQHRYADGHHSRGLDRPSHRDPERDSLTDRHSRRRPYCYVDRLSHDRRTDSHPGCQPLRYRVAGGERNGYQCADAFEHAHQHRRRVRLDGHRDPLGNSVGGA